MRIGIVAPPWLPVPPPAYGGTESIVDLLARSWKAAGHEVVLCATGDSTCDVDRRFLHERALAESMGAILPEFNHVLFAYDALGDCDIIHDHTLLGPVVAPSSRVSPNGHDVPIVSTCHGPFDEDLLPIFRAIGRRASIIAISADQATRAAGVPIRRVIHHGIDPAEYPVGTGTGDFLLFLGRMSPTKGVHRAIDLARRTGSKLLIAAKCREPLERQYFEEVVHPKLGGDVEYLGEVSGVDKLELLGEAQALLNPIQWPEPFGLVMIEAMACGTPVIASDCGAAPEIVDQGTTGFIGADDDELVASIARVDQLDRSACRAAVEGYFSATRMAAEYVEVFDSILREGVRIDLRGARQGAFEFVSSS
jgi:glycosyltransferase involved in cell wall biosynthesis